MLEERRKADPELDTVIRFIDFADADLVRLKKLGPVMAPKLPALNDAFFDLILKDPKMASFITPDVDAAALKTKVLDWLKSLFTGTVDEDFVNYQEQIGYKHGKYRVAPVAVAPTMTLLRMLVPKQVTDDELAGIGESREDATKSILKLLDITHFLMDRNYHNRLIETTGMSKELLERLMAA